MSKFISSKKTYEFTNPKSGETLRIPAQYIGTVPDWVIRTWLFRAAVKETSITYVGNSQPESVPEVPEQPAQEPPAEVPEEDVHNAPEQGDAKGKKKV